MDREHDKNPALLFDTLTRLHEEAVPFRLSVLGERCREVPEEFGRAQSVLQVRRETVLVGGGGRWGRELRWCVT